MTHHKQPNKCLMNQSQKLIKCPCLQGRQSFVRKLWHIKKYFVSILQIRCPWLSKTFTFHNTLQSQFISFYHLHRRNCTATLELLHALQKNQLPYLQATQKPHAHKTVDKRENNFFFLKGKRIKMIQPKESVSTAFVTSQYSQCVQIWR